ncbi:MAG: sensor histidine kinase [Flavobacteriaceae bacterium]
MATQNSTGTIVLFILILFVLGVFLVLIFLIFLKRKNNLIKDKIAAEQHYKQELVKTQVEIREETLRNISWELHDNIGQIMTLAKIQVQNSSEDSEKIEEATDTIAKALNELRALSKSINPETIKNLNIIEALELELSRFNRLNFLTTSFEIKGEKKYIDSNSGTILFRILQEFFSNTIKYSQGSELKVCLNFKQKELEITAEDNGLGFDVSNVSSEGQGLINMKKRAELVKAEFYFKSDKNKGTSLKLIYPL